MLLANPFVVNKDDGMASAYLFHSVVPDNELLSCSKQSLIGGNKKLTALYNNIFADSVNVFLEQQSLLYSLLLSGSETVIAPISYKSPLVTNVFYKRYFRYLCNGKGKGAALQQTNKILHQEFEEQENMADFVLIGDFR